MAAFLMALVATLALLMSTRAAAADELPVAPEVAAEAASVVTEPEPEPEPVPAAADTAEPEAEVAASEEAAAPEEAAIAEESAAPTPPSEPQPKPEPQPESPPAEATDGGAAGTPVLDSLPVRAAGEIARKIGVRQGSSEDQVVPVPAPVDVTREPADLVAGLEPVLAALTSPLKELAGPLKSLAPLEALNRDQLGEVGSLAQTNAGAGSNASPTGTAPVPGGLLPDQVTRLPDRRPPVATPVDRQSKTPIATRLITSPAPPSALEGVSVLHRIHPSGQLFSPTLPVPMGADRAPVAMAAAAGGPTGPFAPERSPFAHSQAGSGLGGSSFIPLLGVLALLALAAPRGYRRCMAVRDLPVPTPLACALDRPG